MKWYLCNAVIALLLHSYLPPACFVFSCPVHEGSFHHTTVSVVAYIHPSPVWKSLVLSIHSGRHGCVSMNPVCYVNWISFLEIARGINQKSVVDTTTCLD